MVGARGLAPPIITSAWRSFGWGARPETSSLSAEPEAKVSTISLVSSAIDVASPSCGLLSRRSVVLRRTTSGMTALLRMSGSCWARVGTKPVTSSSAVYSATASTPASSGAVIALGDARYGPAEMVTVRVLA
jgi:hypothetical protein